MSVTVGSVRYHCLSFENMEKEVSIFGKLPKDAFTFRWGFNPNGDKAPMASLGDVLGFRWGFNPNGDKAKLASPSEVFGFRWGLNPNGDKAPMASLSEVFGFKFGFTMKAKTCADISEDGSKS